MATTVKEFEDYKIVNAHVGLYDEETKSMGEQKPLGCTGTLTLESELRTITKTCAGEVTKEVSKTTKLNGTISAHVSPEVAIEVLGLSNNGLVDGVYGYGGSRNARGVITLDVLDMYEEQKKLIAVPLANFNAGLSVNIESGQEDIAMMEMTFSAMRDTNNQFYYQAFEADITPELVEAWHTNFTPELVKGAPVVGGE